MSIIKCIAIGIPVSCAGVAGVAWVAKKYCELEMDESLMNGKPKSVTDPENVNVQATREHAQIKNKIKVNSGTLTDKSKGRGAPSKSCESISPVVQETAEAKARGETRLSSINVESDKHILFINGSGKIGTVEVEPNSSIENVKLKIHNQLGIPKDEILLIVSSVDRLRGKYARSMGQTKK
ncbi:hypothetical protein QYM36_016711 [Artemia franciscana]|uniref:Ubiquitin-like domain-containing protein n=1 Tax=Artemia franciscana TaxID=6661 RepID=A0AA88HFL4_ARTSF|nr:hypothetical protein QYM36_016711 [Artemia franciscana]